MHKIDTGWSCPIDGVLHPPWTGPPQTGELLCIHPWPVLDWSNPIWRGDLPLYLNIYNRTSCTVYMSPNLKAFIPG